MLVNARTPDDEGNLQRLTDEQIAAQFLLLGAAGHETVSNLVGNGSVALWWYPRQRAELAATPGLIAGAVRRCCGGQPAPLAGRWTTRDVHLHGTTIPADSRVMLVLGSANHDERHYENPSCSTSTATTATRRWCSASACTAASGRRWRG